MKKLLFVKVFDKARLQSGKETKNGLARYLDEYLNPLKVSGSSERNLLRYYSKYIEGNEEAVNTKVELLDALSQYLGFRDYEDFVLKNIEKEEILLSNEEWHLPTRFPEDPIINKVAASLHGEGNAFKKKVGAFLLKLYPSLLALEQRTSGMDFITYGPRIEGETTDPVEFAFLVVQCHQQSFSGQHATLCVSAIEEAKALLGKRGSYTIICNADFSDAEPYISQVEKKLLELEEAEEDRDTDFFDLEGLANFSTYTLDTELRDQIMQSNRRFMREYVEVMEQRFYFKEVPFLLQSFDSIYNNPSLYLTKRATSEIKPGDEFFYSVNWSKPKSFFQEEAHKLNFVVSEFGFGKTSLLLQNFKNLNDHSIRALYIPIGQLEPDAFKDFDTLAQSLFRLIQMERVDLTDPYCQLLFQAWINMLSKRTDLILMFDGLDEYTPAYTKDGLDDVFHCIGSFNAECMISMRKEFWDEQHTNLELAVGLEFPHQDALVLIEWKDEDILNYLQQYKELVSDQASLDGVEAFQKLVEQKKYAERFGDIPKRPLFLDMLIRDFLRGDIGKKNIVELYDSYLGQKFRRDQTGAFKKQTVREVKKRAEDPAAVKDAIYAVLKIAASHMVYNNEDLEAVFMPTISESKLREFEEYQNANFSILELLLLSVLVPFDNRSLTSHRGLKCRFAHKSFQEYFLALYLYDLLADPGGDQNDYDLFQYRFSEGVERFLLALIDMEKDSGHLYFLQKMIPSLLTSDTENFALIKRVYPAFVQKTRGTI